MYLDFSHLFHQSSKDRSGQGRVHIKKDATQWPDEWKTIEYKDYPRLKKVILDAAESGNALFSAIRSRASRRDFTQRKVSLDQLSSLLQYSCGITRTDQTRELRAQPSGGARFPVEVYPLVFVGTDTLPAGVHHYNVRDHALEVLLEKDFSHEDLSQLFSYDWAQRASLALVLTAVFDRNQRKYGERGYRQILIEAGAIVQNAYLVAGELGLSCCAIDGVDEPAIERLIDIDGHTESVICTIVIG